MNRLFKRNEQKKNNTHLGTCNNNYILSELSARLFSGARVYQNVKTTYLCFRHEFNANYVCFFPTIGRHF